MRARPKGSVAEPALRDWLRTHEGAPGAEVAALRLAYMEREGTGRYLRALEGLPEVRPHVLITAQASGRWSTTNPSLMNLPKSLIEGPGRIIAPRAGTWWLLFDLEAVEARLAAEYAEEEADLRVLREGGDLHLATACDMFREPMDTTDPRRKIAKTTRFNLQYAYTYRGILDAPDLALLGGREAALDFARRFVLARPALESAKQRVFVEAYRAHMARTAFGRPRRLTGDERTQGKEGWSHMIQGTVTGIMNRVLIALAARWPTMGLILNKHDGVILEFPSTESPEVVQPECRAVVEGPWWLWSRAIHTPATWEVVPSP